MSKQGEEEGDKDYLPSHFSYQYLCVFQDEGSHPPRLFQLSNAKGYINVEEIHDFVQVFISRHQSLPFVFYVAFFFAFVHLEYRWLDKDSSPL